MSAGMGEVVEEEEDEELRLDPEALVEQKALMRPEYRYWQFLLLFTTLLLTLHLLLRPSPTSAKAYNDILGFLGLTIEATLPLPQIYANHMSQSCKGFRVSVIANWLFGDAMKMGYFFLSADDRVPWAFKVCGVFQALCDVVLGGQWWVFGEGEEVGGLESGRGVEFGRGFEHGIRMT